MKNYLEQINFEQKLPLRAFVQRVNSFKLHWHSQIELLYVVRGSINVYIDGVNYLLSEGDVMFIGGTEIHSTNKTEEDNLVVVLQLLGDVSGSFSALRDMVFRRDVFLSNQRNDAAGLDDLRQLLLKIIWEMNKKTPGYESVILGYANMLVGGLTRNGYLVPKTEQVTADASNLARLSGVMDYVGQHFSEKISLKVIADEQHISYYYLSHFFKETAGITFREYLNNVRLDKSLELMRDKRKTLTAIASDCGFSSVKGYTSAFKEKYGCTPNEYRKKNDGKTVNGSALYLGSENELYYTSVNSVSDLSFIFEKLKQAQPVTLAPHQGVSLCNVSVDGPAEGEPLVPYWRNLITFGRAAECLREDLRAALRDVQREMPFRYVRFHGIFNDEMMVYNVRENGEVVYNWAYVDQVFDFLLGIGLKPFIELSFMPPQIASGEQSVFWWRGNITPPKELHLWTDLVGALIRHCIGRYGYSEVATWYAEVWNEPDYTNVFWQGSREEYFRFYHATALAVREACPELKVGGPAITHIQSKTNGWIHDFCVYCTEHHTPLDFISFHVYTDNPMEYQHKGDGIFPFLPQRSFMGELAVRDILEFTIDTAKAVLGDAPEYHVTEFNISPKPRFFVRDTAFMTPFLISNLLDCRHTVSSLGFWVLSDIFEELRAPISPFHGGLGLINFQGIKKPAYYAYWLLSKLGNTVLAHGADYIVTRQGQTYQILCFNATYFDEITAAGDFSGVTSADRYSVYLERPTKQFAIQLSGLRGNYKQLTFTHDREHGSAFDLWREMGMPEEMTADEVAFLQSQCMPHIHSATITAKGSCSVNITVPVHGCVLLVLTPQA